MWGLYIDYSRNAVVHNVQCCRHIYSGAYVSNVKYISINVPGNIVDCIGFI